ncbi:MAG TPA: MBL fold metallo-hydrolase [Gammaproteobacteria bacterium]|nr:MBL fold metallo-hydrolase [Gammaproteobacteria bacterium]
MQIMFLGAAGCVTGSKYLLSLGNKKVLVDCGLFQGSKELRLRNWAKFPIDPSEISAVLLTHAHIDHTGYVPLLVKNGFKGSVYCTPGTRDLCEILLRDSAKLQEEEAELANKYQSSKHKPALPLYTLDDAEKALKQFKVIDFNKTSTLFEGAQFSFLRAGHIIGASFIKLFYENKSLLFSGDIGRFHDPIMREPVKVDGADYLILESTYGDRPHTSGDPQAQLAEVINKTIKRGGSVIIPAFAVGRSQSMLYYLYQLKVAHKIPEVPIYLDSPMAINATKLLCDHAESHKLGTDQCHLFCGVANYINKIDDSIALDNVKHPVIIIASSGMATGGRVLNHLKKFMPDAKNTILFTGYQAKGTRGDRIVSGEKEIKIYGETVPVNAEIAVLQNISAHADYPEILDWLSHFTQKPKQTFLVHGEPESAKNFKQKIEEKLHWHCEIPTYLQKITLS